MARTSKYRLGYESTNSKCSFRGLRPRFPAPVRLPDCRLRLRRSGREPRKGLLGQFDRALRHLHLLIRSVQIEERGPDFVFYLAAQILQPGAVFPQGGFRLQDIGMRLSALEDSEYLRRPET